MVLILIEEWCKLRNLFLINSNKSGKNYFLDVII